MMVPEFSEEEKAWLNIIAKETQQRMFWGPSLPKTDKIVFCYINLVDGEKHVLAMHNVDKDIMYKMKPDTSYERSDEVWPEDEFVFERYARLMDI